MYRRIAQLLVIFSLSIGMTSFAWSADTQNWKIKIRTAGSSTYGYAVAGVKTTATDGYDLAWDVQAILDNLNVNETDPFIYVYFPHPDLNLNLGEDIRDPALPEQWIVQIDSNITGQLTITWPDLAAVLPDHGATLTDLDGAGTQTINMQESASFSFDNIAGNVRQFQLAINDPPAPEPFFLSAVNKNKVIKLDWDLAQEQDAHQYVVYLRINDGAYQERQRLSIDQNQFLDKLDKRIIRSTSQTQLTYKVETVTAAGDVLRSSIEVTLIYTSSYQKR